MQKRVVVTTILLETIPFLWQHSKLAKILNISWHAYKDSDHAMTSRRYTKNKKMSIKGVSEEHG